MVYGWLHLGELKRMEMVFQLAEHSTRHPRRIVEDVLIKVNEFIFLVDFISLETGVVMSPKH